MTNWPWPLGGVQDWFESLWSGINSWISDAVSGLWTTVSAAFDTVKTWITDGFSAAWTTISAAFDTVKTWITDGFSAAWTTVSAAFSTVKTWVTDGFSAAWTSLSAAFATVSTWVSGAVTSLTNSVSAFFTDLWGKITTSLSAAVSSISTFFGDLWTKVSGAVSDLGTSLVNGLTLAVGTIAGYVQDAITGAVTAVTSGIQSALGWMWTQLQAIASAVTGAISAVRGAVEPAFTGIMNAVTGTISSAFSPHTLPEEVQKASEDLAKNLQETMKNILPQGAKSMPSFADVQKSAILTTVIFTGAQIIGNVAGIAIDLVHPIKPIGVQVAILGIIRSVSENVITAPIIQIPLEAGVYRPMRYYYNAMNPNVIPGSGDMINMVVREVIGVEVFYENMLYQGFDKFWSEAYWEAHWVLPSFGDLRIAMWRGIISPGEFGKYVVLHDYKPEPRPGMEKTDQAIMEALSYNLPGAIETRWMFRHGLVPVEKIEELLLKGGMAPEWAPAAAEAIAKQQFLTEINRLRDNAKSRFTEGFIPEATLKADLEELGYPPDWVGYHVRDALEDREYDHKKDLLAYYLDAFVKDITTEPDFESAVKEILVAEDAAQLFIDKAYVRKYMKPPVTPDLSGRLLKAQADYDIQGARVTRLTEDVEEYKGLMAETESVYDARIAAVEAELAVATEEEKITKLEDQLTILRGQKDVKMVGMAAALTSKERIVSEAEVRLAYLEEMAKTLKVKVAA